MVLKQSYASEDIGREQINWDGYAELHICSSANSIYRGEFL